MRDTLDRAHTLLLTLAAVAVAGVLVHREFARRKQEVIETPTVPVRIADWQPAILAGVEVGQSGAPVNIIELADLECPACRQYYSTLEGIIAERRGRVSVVVIQMPLPQHRFARQAARAVECASERGKAKEIISLAFAKQDSLGLKSWGSFASEVGLTDSVRFARCVAGTVPFSRLEQGEAFARRISARRTPTVIVNGWQLPGLPSKGDLVAYVDLIVKGEDPFTSATRLAK